MMIARAVLAMVLFVLSTPVGVAETVDTQSCKQDLAATWAKMQEMVGRLKGVARAAQDEKCATYRRHVDVVVRAREVFDRCKTGRDRTSDVAHMDGALDDITSVIDRECNGGKQLRVQPHVRALESNGGELPLR
jgi:hypothetical protein